MKSEDQSTFREVTATNTQCSASKHWPSLCCHQVYNTAVRVCVCVCTIKVLLN